LLKAELSRGQLSPDFGGISVASQHRFLEFAAIETNDSLLGLHVAAEICETLVSFSTLPRLRRAVRSMVFVKTAGGHVKIYSELR
jgi:hypothetical protein